MTALHSTTRLLREMIEWKSAEMSFVKSSVQIQDQTLEKSTQNLQYREQFKISMVWVWFCLVSTLTLGVLGPDQCSAKTGPDTIAYQTNATLTYEIKYDVKLNIVLNKIIWNMIDLLATFSSCLHITNEIIHLQMTASSYRKIYNANVME